MTDWQIVHGNFQPAEFDSTLSENTVYQRRNIQFISNDNGAFWQYEERKLSHEEYYKLRTARLEDELTQTQLALADLYETILEG